MVWIKFVICVAIVFIAGTRLSKYGDIIAEKTGLGRVWVGTILLAAATSLPELVVGISSVTIIDKPDLTVGNLFGASLFNLAAIAYMDILYRQGPLLSFVSPHIALSAVASGLLIALVGTSIFIAHNISSLGIANYIGLYSPILFILYLLIYQMLARYEKTSQPLGTADSDVHPKHEDVSSKRVYIYFAFATLAIIGAGTWLSFVGDEITESTGLRASFVGTLFPSCHHLYAGAGSLHFSAQTKSAGHGSGKCRRQQPIQHGNHHFYR